MNIHHIHPNTWLTLRLIFTEERFAKSEDNTYFYGNPEQSTIKTLKRTSKEKKV